MAHGAPDGPYSTYLFGLNVELPFAVRGCPPRAEARGRPSLTVSVVGREAVAELWAGRTAVRLLGDRDGPDRAGLVVEGDGTGYRLSWEGAGEFVLPGDGRIVSTRMPGGEDRWERFLVAQVLPLAAVMAGAEVLHASAVLLDDEVLGLVGASGAGKSTLAGELVARGATFFTDDVLAVTDSDGRVIAHPGPNLLRLDSAPEHERSPVGQVDASGKVGTATGTASGARPLGRLLFIERFEAITDVSIGEEVAFEDLAGATFNLLVSTPERLSRQLDLYARIATDVGAVRAAIPASLPAAEAAALLEASVAS